MPITDRNEPKSPFPTSRTEAPPATVSKGRELAKQLASLLEAADDATLDAKSDALNAAIMAMAPSDPVERARFANAMFRAFDGRGRKAGEIMRAERVAGFGFLGFGARAGVGGVENLDKIDRAMGLDRSERPSVFRDPANGRLSVSLIGRGAR